MLKWLRNNALGTYLLTLRFGELVGEDEVGNRYYRRRRGKDWRQERRWVVYKSGDALDASQVPPGWNAWLHHNFEQSPAEAPLPVRRWEKPHRPNPSGTREAYVPPGHTVRGSRRDRATGDYEAWRP